MTTHAYSEHQAGDALLTREECGRALRESLDCVYVHDFEGRFLDANSAALELLGYEREELLTLTLPSLLETGEQAEALKAVALLKESGSSPGLAEYRVRCKDGGYARVEARVSVVFRDGRPHAALGVARDITARRHAEEVVANECDFLADLVDNIEEAMVVCDSQGLLTRLNQAALRVHGLPVTPIPVERWAEYVREVEVTVVPKLGSPRWVVAGATPCETHRAESQAPS